VCGKKERGYCDTSFNHLCKKCYEKNVLDRVAPKIYDGEEDDFYYICRDCKHHEITDSRHWCNDMGCEIGEPEFLTFCEQREEVE